jgi:hypothetical protein
VLDRVESAADVQATMDSSDRWNTLAFMWYGLRMLGVPGDSLTTFADTSSARPWRRAPRNSAIGSVEEHDRLLARTDGVCSLSFLDLNATPPFNYAHDHFGFRDRFVAAGEEGLR